MMIEIVKKSFYFAEEAFEYSWDKFEHWYENSIKSNMEDEMDLYVTINEQLFEVIEKLNIITLKDFEGSDLFDRVMNLNFSYLEEDFKRSIPHLDKDEEDMSFGDAKDIVKASLKWFKKKWKHFYFFKKIVKMIAFNILKHGLKYIVNPLYWYRHWRDFFKQRSRII